jgi:prepilin-type N-terminal cleavage/methylation domain-containing protein
MQISPPKPARLPVTAAREGEHGFSLLELMVVLAIMGIMLSLVGLRLNENIEGSRFMRTSEAAMADILIFRADAVMSAQPRSLIPHSAQAEAIKARRRENLRRFDLPTGWRVEGDIIEISPSGVCSGGTLAVTNPQGRRVVYRLRAPRCTPERLSLGV